MNEMWRAVWDGPSFVRLVVTRPDRGELILEADGGEHPLFGRSHAIVSDGERVATCGAVDWRRPSFIPPIDRPAAIPRGGGSAILGALATIAAEADVEALRYRGPYPTAALFDSLLHCFTVDDAVSARERFTADVEDKAVRGVMDEVPVDFRPAPCVWTWPAPAVCVESRESIRRVFIDGHAFSAPSPHRRLIVPKATEEANADVDVDVDVDDPRVAMIMIAGRPWREVLRISANGSVLAGPHPPSSLDSPLVGTLLPTEIGEVLAEVLASRAPRLLAGELRRVVLARALVWADTGDALAQATATELRLHAVLGERLADESPGRVLSLLVDAVEPVARRVAQSSLAKLV